MAIGTPLLFHGGPVMMTPSTGPLIVTPIFWNPSGHPMSLSYKLVILKYFAAVSLASGQNTNASGCTVASTDTAGIYADGTGYDACLDDTQLQAQIDAVTAARALPHDNGHIYLLYLPKHVESCFFPGSTTTNANACTINFQPSAAFCAYHNEDPANAIYGNEPFPIYQSKTNFTCGTEVNFGAVESPNGVPDADVVLNSSSHETVEAVTDPDTMTGWFDSSGFEIGDECNFVFGATQGSPGRLFNQTIFGFHFLTQEEFSNKDFAITGGGCVQSAKDEA